MKLTQFACLVLAVVASAAASAAQNAVTIYSSASPGAVSPQLYRPSPGRGPWDGQAVPGFSIVRHLREMDLQKGVGALRFSDVAALIEPTTVRFESLTDPRGTRVLEQDFQFDLVGSQRLLEKYLDREIIVEREAGEGTRLVRGTLLSARDGLVIKDETGAVQMLQSWNNIQFPALPEGLMTRPTLVWQVSAARGGSHQTRVSYETKGMTWWADYNLVYADGRNANAGTLDISAWVSILNQSGASYPDAGVKLIAGDVHRAPQPGYPKAARAAAEMLAMDAGAGFEEKSFFEFHLYTLGRSTDLPDNSTKQIELFPPTRGVHAQKILLYYGQQGGYYPYYASPAMDRNYGIDGNQKVDVYLKFRNDKDQGMGMPLPAGRIRVSKLDEADGSLEFIGEDVIDHTPKGEDVLIKMGSAFDVVGERIQADFSVDSRAQVMEEVIEIELRNHKQEPVEVLVKENLYRWTNWTIVESSHRHEKQDSRTVHFPVKVAADSKVKLRYRVRYSW